MEILGSTQYVNLETQKDVWYQLEVINMWDWKTKAICHNMGRDGYVYSFCLYCCTPASSTTYNRKLVEELTDEMKKELIGKGYTLAN